MTTIVDFGKISAAAALLLATAWVTVNRNLIEGAGFLILGVLAMWPLLYLEYRYEMCLQGRNP